MVYGLQLLFTFYYQVVPPPSTHGVLPPSFVEGSYVSPVTLKRGDLYIKGWVVDWWLREFLSRMVDDLVEFVVRDCCSEILMFGPSDVRFVRDV